MLLFIILPLFLFPLALSQDEPIEIHLGSEELREWPSIKDRDTADNLGTFMSDFFDDSKSQVC